MPSFFPPKLFLSDAETAYDQSKLFKSLASSLLY